MRHPEPRRNTEAPACAAWIAHLYDTISHREGSALEGSTRARRRDPWRSAFRGRQWPPGVCRRRRHVGRIARGRPRPGGRRNRARRRGRRRGCRLRLDRGRPARGRLPPPRLRVARRKLPADPAARRGAPPRRTLRHPLGHRVDARLDRRSAPRAARGRSGRPRPAARWTAGAVAAGRQRSFLGARVDDPRRVLSRQLRASGVALHDCGKGGLPLGQQRGERAGRRPTRPFRSTFARPQPGERRAAGSRRRGPGLAPRRSPRRRHVGPSRRQRCAVGPGLADPRERRRARRSRPCRALVARGRGDREPEQAPAGRGRLSSRRRRAPRLRLRGPRVAPGSASIASGRARGAGRSCGRRPHRRPRRRPVPPSRAAFSRRTARAPSRMRT